MTEEREARRRAGDLVESIVEVGAMSEAEVDEYLRKADIDPVAARAGGPEVVRRALERAAAKDQ